MLTYDSKSRSKSDTGVALGSSSGYTSSARLDDASNIEPVDRKLRGWSLRRRSNDSSEDVRGPLGLSLLHLAAEPLVDLVFVHGLRGGSIKTWRKGTDAKLFWPQNWLPLEAAFKNASIHTFGYNADWGDVKDSFLNLHDFGRALLGELKTSPYIRNGGTSPIIFIGHSMGGLVIKKAYILARQDQLNQDFAKRIRCIFFLATPHRGSDYAHLLNNILKASGILSARQYISDVEQNSATTQIINDEFPQFADDLILYSFYETIKMNFGLSSNMIVERDSAILGYKNERTQYLNANHRDVCKYDDQLDTNYITVRNALATTIEELLRDNLLSQAEHFKAQMKAIHLYLNVSEKPIDDLHVGVEGTCDWLNDREDFQEWRDRLEDSLDIKRDKNFRCYWVSAKPGTGKSALTGSVVTHLQGRGLDCSYYFFHHGNKSTQALSGLLRSLAYQMASSNAKVRKKLLELIQDGINFDKDDEGAIWRKTFIGGILKVDIHRPQYWIIDALDECINYPVLFSFLSKIELAFPLRIFVTSRIHPDIEKHFNRLGNGVIETKILPQDTHKDIRVFVQSRIGDLPVANGTREQQALEAKILSKCDGCFLWVRLVLEELEHIYDEKSIETVLDEMPVEMSDFYGRTVDLMSRVVREKNITKSILRWCVVSARPLDISELQHAIAVDIGANVRNMEKSIEGLCGNLVIVDKKGGVQMVHQTARDYLIQNTDSEFGVDVGFGHEKAAIACLDFLCSGKMKPPRNRRLLSTRRIEPSVFREYACISFSEHIFASSSEEDNILVALSTFLRTNVLSWIEYVAQKGSLYYLTRTAKNLKGYLERRAKYTSPLSAQVQLVEAWATDILRLVAKFGATMISDPTSIYFLIPPLCPTSSAIYKQFAKSPDGLLLVGRPNSIWEDCVSCINFLASRATAVACGGNLFAIGMRSGKITIYNQTTFQVEQSFEHSESVKVLKFDSSSRFLVSTGLKSIKLWDVMAGELWCQNLASPCIAIEFGSQYITGVLKNSHIVYWNFVDGIVQSNQYYRYQDPNNEGNQVPFKAPLASAFSPDQDMVAFAYRGQYVCLWDLTSHELVGYCFRAAIDGNETFGLAVGTVLFNPNPDISLIVVGYQDGDLAIFDPWSQEMAISVEANALSLASSPDGRTLATGDSNGTVQLWDFETLTLLYRIKTYDFEVKALAFSGDGLRLVDIRDSRSKIWEPTVLVRKNFEEDVSVSDATAISAVTVGDDDFNDIIRITALTAHPVFPTLFGGKSDGSVVVYDCETAAETDILYSHVRNVFITTIACSEDNILASADAGGTVKVWKLSKSSASAWAPESQVMVISLGTSIRQLEFNFDGLYLLIACANSAEIWSIGSKNQAGLMEFDENDQIIGRWIALPDPEAALFLLHGNGIESYNWVDFSRILPPSPNLPPNVVGSNFPDKSEIHTAVLRVHDRNLIVDFRNHPGNNSLASLYIHDCSSMSSPSKEQMSIKSNISVICNRIKYLAGVFRSRLIFIDQESWLSSIDLLSQGEDEYTRHFYIPHDVFSGNNGGIAVVSKAGDIAFVNEGELALVRNGMKFQNTFKMN